MNPCPRAGCGKTARPVVCPAKAGVFSRRQTCRGKKQQSGSLDSRVAGNQNPEAYRQSLPGGSWSLSSRLISNRGRMGAGRSAAHQAIGRVAAAVVRTKTTVIDVDLPAYFDTVRHDILLRKVAQRVDDSQVLKLPKSILKASGKRGVRQGGVISPLLSNVYLNEVEKKLELAKRVTRRGRYTYIEYARFADDLVILVDGYRRWKWLAAAAERRLREALAKLDVQLNHEKTGRIDLARGENFGFLGFDFRRARTRRGVWGVRFVPKMKARTALLCKLKEVFDVFAPNRSIGSST